ncbi:NAD-dependent epimerase/dehydratase family protein [Pelagibius sp. 7325]|uniref:NAD-dependent epimerase/dehydratase family protein n=1 Tax=Pelagibius sp. 7325 TaxID=3131994 RepID=UPI0030EE9717
MKLIVTGVTGFAGRVVCERLIAGGHRVTALTRRATSAAEAGLPPAVTVHAVGNLETYVPAGELAGAQAVIHLAAKVHVMTPTAADEAQFHAVNVTATERLAQAAAEAGVGRFIFASTIKVNGESTIGRSPFTADDPPAPTDSYARSKQAAEESLLAMSSEMEVAILRPPLVYGPAVKGNLAALMRLAALPLPLPLGALSNRRSLVGVTNLADALIHLATAPADSVAGRVFLVRDCDVSTGDLVRALRHAMGRPPLLLPAPEALMGGALSLCGLGRYRGRIFGDLRVDDTALRATGWRPSVSMTDEIGRMVAAAGN